MQSSFQKKHTQQNKKNTTSKHKFYLSLVTLYWCKIEDVRFIPRVITNILQDKPRE